MRYPVIVVAATLLFGGSAAFAQTKQTSLPSQGATTYASENVARANCGSYPVVWMNTNSKIYHASGSKDYGKTKEGSYMCRDAADKIGRAAKNEKDPTPIHAPGSPQQPPAASGALQQPKPPSR